MGLDFDHIHKKNDLVCQRQMHQVEIVHEIRDNSRTSDNVT